MPLGGRLRPAAGGRSPPLSVRVSSSSGAAAHGSLRPPRPSAQQASPGPGPRGPPRRAAEPRAAKPSPQPRALVQPGRAEAPLMVAGRSDHCPGRSWTLPTCSRRPRSPTGPWEAPPSLPPPTYPAAKDTPPLTGLPELLRHGPSLRREAGHRAHSGVLGAPTSGPSPSLARAWAGVPPLHRKHPPDPPASPALLPPRGAWRGGSRLREPGKDPWGGMSRPE